MSALFFSSDRWVQAADPSPQPSSSAAQSVSVDLAEFQKELQQHIQNQRKEWEEKQSADLAHFIVSELQTKMDNRLTVVLCSNICTTIEFNLQRLDPSPEKPSQELTHQYYRWAISDLASRKAISENERKDIDIQAKDALLEYAAQLKRDIPPAKHARIDVVAEDQVRELLKSAHDPLFPGLKHPVAKKEYQKLLTEMLSSQKSQRELLKIVQGIGNTAIAGATAQEADATFAVELPFMVFRGQIEHYGLNYDEPLRKADASWITLQQKELNSLFKSAGLPDPETEHKRVLEEASKKAESFIEDLETGE